MSVRTVFLASDNRLRTPWRLLLFAVIFPLIVSPLLLVPSALLQFLLADILLVGLLIAWARWVDRKPFAQYGLMPDGLQLRDLLVGIAIGVASVALLFAASVAFGAIEPVAGTGVVLDAAVLAFAAKMLLVGFWEETVFRGFLYTNLREGFAGTLSVRGAVAAALLVSSLLFGLVHLGTDHVSIASLAILSFNGLVFCVPFLLTGRLGLSIGLHAPWNFAQLEIFGFAMSGNSAAGSWIAQRSIGPAWWTGGDYGPEAGLAGVFGLVVMLALTFAFLRLVPSQAASPARSEG